MQLESSLSSLPVSDPPPLAGDTLVRQLGARYFLVLVAVICLVMIDQALIQPLLLRMNAYAPTINMAGRQRMLSQKLAKAALALQSAQDETRRMAFRAELRNSLNDWATAHEAFQRGAADGGAAPISSPAIRDAWSRLEPHFGAMRSAAELLGRVSTISTNELSTLVGTIIEHEPGFLGTMDRLVSLMEAQSAVEIRRLRFLAFAVASTIVALVSALGWFVIRPATQAIRGQVDELESQVTLRTRELEIMLTTLRSEIAERAASQARNQVLAAQLAHANRVESVGHMAAGLAHELNQPFAAIVNYTEACIVALERPLDNQSLHRLRDFIERVRQASLRAGSIVRRIRNFVRPGSSSTMPVELVALVQEVVELCRPEAQCAQAVLAFDPPTGAEIVVEADPIQIQQVLVNLIQNALHAVRDAPAHTRRIALQIHAQMDAVQIHISDNGPGLANVDSNTVFMPFHTTKANGLGVGLSICRSIIEQHQGTIWAQSLRPKGAQFSFSLPRLSNNDAKLHRQTDRVCR